MPKRYWNMMTEFREDPPAAEAQGGPATTKKELST